MNDEEPAGQLPVAEQPAARQRKRPRAAGVGSALASRTTGWMVAAALAGSLVTLLLTGQLHSSQVSYVRPAAAERPAQAGAPARQSRAGVTAPAPASTRARQLPITVKPGRVVYRRGQLRIVTGPGRHVQVVPAPGSAGLKQIAICRKLSVLLPRAYRRGVALPGPVVVAPRAVRGRLRALLPRAYRQAVAAPRLAGRPGLPACGRLSVILPRAYRQAAPARLRAIARPGVVPAPATACMFASPARARTRTIHIPGGRRLVIVSRVPAPRQLRLRTGQARRAIVRVKPISGGRKVIIIAPGVRRTARLTCVVRLRPTRRS